MARTTDEYVVKRFFEVFSLLPEPERRGIILGLRSASNTMAAAKQEAQMPLFEATDECDSSDD